MAGGAIMVKIEVDDKGNPRIVQLGKNAKIAKGEVAPLGDVLGKVFASAAMLRGLSMLNRGLIDAIKNANQFELAIARISSIGGVGPGAALDSIREKAKNLSTETEHSAVNLSNAMLELVKMGYEPTQAMQMIEHTSNMATAAQEDLAWSTVNTANIMKAFQKPIEDTEHVVNVMTTALNATSLNLEEYIDAMRYVAPVAHSVGISLEETSAILGLLSDQSIKGSLGGTSLKNMMLKLLKPTKEVTTAIKDMDVQNMSLTQIMQRLNDAGLSTADMLKQFDLRALSGALAVGKNAERVEELTKKLTEAGETAKSVADKIRNTAVMQWKELLNTFQLIGITLNENLTDNTKTFLENMKSGLLEVNGYIKDHKDELKAIADKALELATVLSNTLSFALKTAIINWKALSVAIGAALAIKYINRIHKMNMAFGSIDFTKWTTSFNDLAGAMNFVMLAAVGTELAIQKIIEHYEKLSKANAFGAQNFSSEEHLTALTNLEAEYDKFARAQTIAQGLYSKGNSQAIRQADVLINKHQNQLNTALDEYGKKWGNAAKSMVDTREELDKIIHNLRVLNSTTSSTAPGKKTGGGGNKKPFGSELGDTGGAWTKDFFSDLAKANLADATDARDSILKLVNVDLPMQNQKDWDSWFKKLAETRDAETKKAEKKKLRSWELEKKSYATIAESMADIYINMNERMLNATLERIDAERLAIERQHDVAIAFAGDSAFQKAMIEQKFYEKQSELDKKAENERKAFERKQLAIDIIRAGADMTRGIIGVMADTKGGLISRFAAGIAYSAYAASFVAQLAAMNFRAGSKDTVRGNSTSDTMLAKVSPGERIFSADEVNSAGGNQIIQQTIDRGTSYNRSASVNVTIGTVIGTKQFVRDAIIPTVKKELSR
jgi:TP901 family phage tail tape measure protein